MRPSALILQLSLLPQTAQGRFLETRTNGARENLVNWLVSLEGCCDMLIWLEPQNLSLSKTTGQKKAAELITRAAFVLYAAAARAVVALLSRNFCAAARSMM
jgi:hypothetical protein